MKSLFKGYNITTKSFGWRYLSITIPWLWDFTKRGPFREKRPCTFCNMQKITNKNSRYCGMCGKAFK